MSSIGKILLVVTLIGAGASLGLSFMVVGKKNELSAELDSTKTNLETTKSELETSQKDLAQTKATLDSTKSDLTQANSKADSLQSDLTKAQARASELETNLKTTEAKVTAAEKKLSDFSAVLDGKSPEELKAAAQKTEEELNALQREKKIIEDQLAAQTAEVKRLQDRIERSRTGSMPAGIAGKVLSVNTAWNFVVINVGEKDGVVENGLFIVHRGQDLVGKLKVVSIEANTAVADILPEWTKGGIQAGDDVFN